jgi:hypothetical protein
MRIHWTVILLDPTGQVHDGPLLFGSKFLKWIRDTLLEWISSSFFFFGSSRVSIGASPRGMCPRNVWTGLDPTAGSRPQTLASPKFIRFQQFKSFRTGWRVPLPVASMSCYAYVVM